jgi:hypothetical protein
LAGKESFPRPVWRVPWRSAGRFACSKKRLKHDSAVSRLCWKCSNFLATGHYTCSAALEYQLLSRVVPAWLGLCFQMPFLLSFRVRIYTLYTLETNFPIFQTFKTNQHIIKYITSLSRHTTIPLHHRFLVLSTTASYDYN